MTDFVITNEYAAARNGTIDVAAILAANTGIDRIYDITDGGGIRINVAGNIHSNLDIIAKGSDLVDASAATLSGGAKLTTFLGDVGAGNANADGGDVVGNAGDNNIQMRATTHYVSGGGGVNTVQGYLSTPDDTIRFIQGENGHTELVLPAKSTDVVVQSWFETGDANRPMDIAAFGNHYLTNHVTNLSLTDGSYVGQSEENIATIEAYSVLGRKVEGAGISYWSGQIAGGHTNGSALLDLFFNSDEGKAGYAGLSVVQQIAKVYQNVLGREPDAGGAGFFAGLMARGATLGEVAKGIVFSDEERAKVVAEIGNGHFYSNDIHAADNAPLVGVNAQWHAYGQNA